MKVDILGTKYTIKFKDTMEDKKLLTCSGYCDITTKTIIVLNKDDNISKENLEVCKRQTIRHEILHAFLFESGLWGDSNETSHWAINEEMTDWFAIQSPKIFKIYRKLGVDKD